MRHLLGVVLATVVVALCAVSPAVAHPRHEGGGGPVVTPVHRVGGLSGEEFLAQDWLRVLSLTGEDPYLGSCVPVGEKGRAFEIRPGPDLTAHCTVPRNSTLIVAPGAECSNVEPPPFYGADEAAQRACAIAADQTLPAVLVSVDGAPAVDIRDPRFEIVTPQLSVQLPPGNILGVEPQPATFVAHAWAAAIRHLAPGRHTITIEITGGEIAGTVTATIDVEGCGG
jgi:hypothetical protein